MRMFRVLGEAGRECTGLDAPRLCTGRAARARRVGARGLLRDPRRTRRRGDQRDTAVILFWLCGGPGHMETWDPKPGRSGQYRGPFGAIRTRLPGVQFGELLPRQAALADRLAVVRTVNHGSGDHTKANHWMLTGFEGPAFNAAEFPPSAAAVARLGRGAAARPESSRDCRPTSPCRTCAAAPTTSSTTPPTWAAGPIRSSSSPIRTRRASASATWHLRAGLTFDRLETAGTCSRPSMRSARSGDGRRPTSASIISARSNC